MSFPELLGDMVILGSDGVLMVDADLRVSGSGRADQG